MGAPISKLKYHARALAEEYAQIEYADLPVNSSIFVIMLGCDGFRILRR
jgi:hypothetical protein